MTAEEVRVFHKLAWPTDDPRLTRRNTTLCDSCTTPKGYSKSNTFNVRFRAI
jgi:hypothetical protein